MDAKHTETERFVLRDDVVDIHALADSVSSTHARLSRLRASGRSIGPDGERLLAASDRLLGRIRGVVSEAVADIDPSPLSRPTPERRSESILARSYLKGLLDTRRAAVAIGEARATLSVAREVLPGVIADAARNDVARMRIVAGHAVEEASRRARGMAHVALSRAAREISRVSERLAPYAKFAQDAHVVPVGRQDASLLAAAMRPLAVATVAGVLAFSLGGAPADAQGLSGTRVAPHVTVTHDAQSLDRLRASAPMMVEPPTIPVPGYMASSPTRVDTGPAQSSALATRDAPDPLAAMRGGGFGMDEAPAPVRPTPPEQARRIAQPNPASVVQAHDGGPNYSVTDAMVQRGTPGAPSKAFIDLAVKTVGVNTENFGDAPNKVGELIWKASDCLAAFGPVAKCRVEAHGISLDFVRGTHTATLLPMARVSAQPRVVASETKSGGLRIVDRDAMTIVSLEASNQEAKLIRETTDIEAENDSDPVAPRP